MRRIPDAHRFIRLLAAPMDTGEAIELGGEATAAASAQTAAPRTRGEGSSSNALRLDRQRRIAAVADGDQHIAQEAVAADALDRRFAEQGAERRIVQPRQLGQARRRQFFARLQASSRAALWANLFQGQTARQSSQP